MKNSFIGKPKNWLDGLYKGVKPYKSLEIVKKEDFIPKAPVRITSKKQLAEEKDGVWIAKEYSVDELIGEE